MCLGKFVRAWKRGVEMYKYVCACSSFCLSLHVGNACSDLSGVGGTAAVVVEGEGWREVAGPAGGSRCRATELTGLVFSGLMNANPNLHRLEAAHFLLRVCRQRRERKRDI